MKQILGIDVGGSAIKGSIVDVKKGCLVGDRIRIPTVMEKPQKVAKYIHEIIEQLDYRGPVGLGFPAPIKNNIIQMAANIHQQWKGVNIHDLLKSKVENTNTYWTLNDADAAGIAEMIYGEGQTYKDDTLLFLTIGTGIGSALFIKGNLLPNTEFGHLKIRGIDAEVSVSDLVRQQKKLSWKKWAKRLQEYFEEIELLISPDVIFIGGGVSKKSEKFLPHIHLHTAIKPASLLNDAGIIGAAYYAFQNSNSNEII